MSETIFSPLINNLELKFANTELSAEIFKTYPKNQVSSQGVCLAEASALFFLRLVKKPQRLIKAQMDV